MEAFVLKKKINSSKQVIIDLPELEEGQEIELVVIYPTLSHNKKNSSKKFFNIADWAKRWATDLGENIQSSDVASFTGRSF